MRFNDAGEGWQIGEHRQNGCLRGPNDEWHDVGAHGSRVVDLIRGRGAPTWTRDEWEVDERSSLIQDGRFLPLWREAFGG